MNIMLGVEFEHERRQRCRLFCTPVTAKKVQKSIDNYANLCYNVFRIKEKQKLIQTPLVVIYAALNFSKSINHKSNKQQFDRGVFSLVQKSTEKY